MLSMKFEQQNDFIQIELKDKSTKKICLDSPRCIGTVLAYNSIETLNELCKCLEEVSVPDSIDIIQLNESNYNGDTSELLDILDEDYDDRLDSFIFLTDIKLLSKELVDIIKVRRDGSIRLFIAVSEELIDTKSGLLRDYRYRDLNNPFVLQNIVYLNDDFDRIYNTNSYYKEQNRLKRVI